MNKCMKNEDIRDMLEKVTKITDLRHFDRIKPITLVPETSHPQITVTTKQQSIS